MTAARVARVLMTADTVGGVWTYALDLAGALAADGIAVALATMGPAPSPAQAGAALAVPGLTLHPSTFALEWMPGCWDDVDAAGAWLLALEREVGADVIHLNGYAHAALPFAAPVVVVAHSCVCSWWRAVKGGDAPPAWDEYRRRVAAGLAAADAVVAPTGAILAAVLAAHGAPAPARARVILNGRDPSGFTAAAGEPLVLGAGRLWDEAKNLAALDACVDRSPWPIYVAGPPAPPGITAAPEAGPAAIRLGALAPAELAAWMRRATIFAAPARYEPFGLTAVEAALSGCALILGDLASLREVWDDAAVYVSPDDPAALGAAIDALAGDRATRGALATRAERRARALTPARMARAYASLYREVCA